MINHGGVHFELGCNPIWTRKSSLGDAFTLTRLPAVLYIDFTNQSPPNSTLGILSQNLQMRITNPSSRLSISPELSQDENGISCSTPRHETELHLIYNNLLSYLLLGKSRFSISYLLISVPYSFSSFLAVDSSTKLLVQQPTVLELLLL